MKNKTKKPNLYIIAGPNGSGKTTFSNKFLPDYVECLEFVNVDLIAKGLSPFTPEKAMLQAGRIMLEQIHSFSQRGIDFGFETTLAGKTYVNLLSKLKQEGYSIHLFFLWIKSVKLALERIELRVQQGGHFVPETTVRRRFKRGVFNFFHEYRALVDSWVIFDNSEDIPKMIAYKESGKLEILDSMLYDMLLKHEDENENT